MYRLLLLLASAVICISVAAQGDSTLKPFSMYFTAEKKFLVLPVKNDAPKRNVELWVDGVNTRYFDIELADGQPDWYAYLDISSWKGKPIEVRVDRLPDQSTAFRPIGQSDADTNAGSNYKESMRGQIHFSPKRGWTNDPNGLVFFKGNYHLFFQHNPYGRNWGNMTWGHAVSADMIHWKEIGDALHPDAAGPVFSGGAVVDSANTSGLAKRGDTAMVMFHTGAKAWGQFASWSTDGKTFETIPQAVVPRINKENRDPKVIWYAPQKKWVMVLYVERDSGRHSMQFLGSPDLLHWTSLSTIMGGKGDDNYLFECPEFYELPVEGGNGEKKWVLTAANSGYAIGSFDGTVFKPETERLNAQHGRDFYAAQTISDQPQGRRIEIGWWRTNTAVGDMTFNQSMSIPLEQRLVKTPDGPRLARLPVPELKSLRGKKFQFSSLTVGAKPNARLQGVAIGAGEIRFTLEPKNSKSVTLLVKGLPVKYDVARGEISIDGVKAKAALDKGRLDIIMFVDRTGVELFTNQGLMFMPVNVNIGDGNKSLSVSAEGGKAIIYNMEVYDLKSIWD